VAAVIIRERTFMGRPSRLATFGLRPEVRAPRGSRERVLKFMFNRSSLENTTTNLRPFLIRPQQKITLGGKCGYFRSYRACASRLRSAYPCAVTACRCAVVSGAVAPRRNARPREQRSSCDPHHALAQRCPSLDHWSGNWSKALCKGRTAIDMIVLFFIAEPVLSIGPPSPGSSRSNLCSLAYLGGTPYNETGPAWCQPSLLRCIKCLRCKGFCMIRAGCFRYSIAYGPKLGPHRARTRQQWSSIIAGPRIGFVNSLTRRLILRDRLDGRDIAAGDPQQCLSL
jgi:hypothetical protein